LSSLFPLHDALPISGNALNIHYLVNFIEKYYLTPQQLGLNNTDIIPRQWAHSILADYSLRDGKYNIAVECHNLTDSKLFDNYRLDRKSTRLNSSHVK